MTRNKTELALLARGLDSVLAKKLREDKWTLSKLRKLNSEELAGLEIKPGAVQAILDENRRPPIPSDVLLRTIFANRWLCCICRDPSRPIIVHHIQPWATSHDHSNSNLAVLCTFHHGEAHSTHSLEVTLTQDRLKKAKAGWEKAVERLDPRDILKATQLQSCQWWYFNHLRLIEIAENLGISITKTPEFERVFSLGLCDEFGYPCQGPGPMYSGQMALILARHMTSILKATVGYASVRNISDDLDRGTLKSLVIAGDQVFLQGSFHFSSLPPDGSGSDLVAGTRSVNGIEVTFVFDRNEGTSCSARNLWLKGTQTLGCLLRINAIQRPQSNKLHIQSTVLAIRSALNELKSRAYDIGLYKSGLIYDSECDENECDFETMN